MKTCFHKKCGVFEACKKVKDFFDTLKSRPKSALFVIALYAVLKIKSDLFLDVLAVVVFNKGIVYFFDELHVRVGHVCQKQQPSSMMKAAAFGTP